jgi:hypothetical protein
MPAPERADANDLRARREGNLPPQRDEGPWYLRPRLSASLSTDRQSLRRAAASSIVSSSLARCLSSAGSANLIRAQI